MKKIYGGATFLFILTLATGLIFAQSNPPAKAKTDKQTFIIAVNRDANAVTIIDAATMQIKHRVAVGLHPHEAVASADGKLAYVANYGNQQSPGSSLSVIDIAAGKEIKKIELGDLKRPHGLVEREGKIYFTAEAAQSVGRYDPKTERVDWTAKTDQMISHMLDASRDGRRIFTANIMSHTVTAIEIVGGETKVTQIKVGQEPESITLSPDGKTLWVGHRKGGQVTIIDAENKKVRETLTAGQIPIRMAFAPDGKHVYIVNPPGGAVLVFDAATGREVKKISIDGAPVGIVFAPDGKRAFVTDLKNSTVHAIDAQNFALAGSVKVETLSDGIGVAQF